VVAVVVLPRPPAAVEVSPNNRAAVPPVPAVPEVPEVPEVRGSNKPVVQHNNRPVVPAVLPEVLSLKLLKPPDRQSILPYNRAHFWSD
jgi:hypothetical protein